MSKQAIRTSRAPAALGPYSQGIMLAPAGRRVVFLSGQVGIDPGTGELEQGLAAQTHRAMQNLRAVLQAAGGELGSLVKTGIFLANMRDFAAANEIYAGYLREPYPARATVEVCRLPKGALVEIDGIALV